MRENIWLNRVASKASDHCVILASICPVHSPDKPNLFQSVSKSCFAIYPSLVLENSVDRFEQEVFDSSNLQYRMIALSRDYDVDLWADISFSVYYESGRNRKRCWNQGFEKVTDRVLTSSSPFARMFDSLRES